MEWEDNAASRKTALQGSQKMKKKLAIISSYNTMCGHASYTHVLKEALSEYYETDIIPINYKLLSNAHPTARKLHAKYLQEVAEKLKKYDCVNIQFEAGLYGYNMATACNNVALLIKSSRSLLVTIHRPVPYGKQSSVMDVKLKRHFVYIIIHARTKRLTVSCR